MQENKLKIIINGIEYNNILNCEISFSYVEDGIEGTLKAKPLLGCVDKLLIELETTDRTVTFGFGDTK